MPSHLRLQRQHDTSLVRQDLNSNCSARQMGPASMSWQQLLEDCYLRLQRMALFLHLLTNHCLVVLPTAASSCSLCPVGSWSSGGSLSSCLPCPFGTTSPAGAFDPGFCYATDQCPPGTRPPVGLNISSPSECICRPGFGGSE
jgi:hypothetical protein